MHDVGFRSVDHRLRAQLARERDLRAVPLDDRGEIAAHMGHADQRLLQLHPIQQRHIGQRRGP